MVTASVAIVSTAQTPSHRRPDMAGPSPLPAKLTTAATAKTQNASRTGTVAISTMAAIRLSRTTLIERARRMLMRRLSHTANPRADQKWPIRRL